MRNQVKQVSTVAMCCEENETTNMIIFKGNFKFKKRYT